MDTLYIEKFLLQVHCKLKEQGISNSKLREDCIEVFEGENVIFKIDAKGGMFYSSDKQFRNIVDKLHDKIQPIVCEVDEYLTISNISVIIISFKFIIVTDSMFDVYFLYVLERCHTVMAFEV